jgi:DNA-binding transcriptional regulator YdaS (Cro superfamily)
MILADYLARNRVTVAAFAARIGRKMTTVHGWLSGARAPSLQAVQDIEAATGGAVTLTDWTGTQRGIGDAKRAARAEQQAAA